MHFSFLKEKRSLQWAGKGIKLALASQANFFLMFIIAIAVIAGGLLLQINRIEWEIVIFLISFILSLEILNTATEKLLDYIEPRFSSVIGQIKDLLAGAVLIASIGAAVVGLLIFLPKIFP